VRSHGDLIEDHIAGLLESKQPETMATIIAARMEASKHAGEELERCLSELTPEARSNILRNSQDLMAVNDYAIQYFRSTSEGLEHLIRYVKMQRSLAGDPESLLAAEDSEW